MWTSALDITLFAPCLRLGKPSLHPFFQKPLMGPLCLLCCLPIECFVFLSTARQAPTAQMEHFLCKPALTWGSCLRVKGLHWFLNVHSGSFSTALQPVSLSNNVFIRGAEECKKCFSGASQV